MKYQIMSVPTELIASTAVSKVNAKTAQMTDEYDEWLTENKTMTVAEVLKSMNYNVSMSTHGHPQINVGNPAKAEIVHYSDNAVAGMNAIADFKKYKTLKRGYHLAWFNPRRDADDVLVTFEYRDDTGFFRFWSWVNECFQPSALNNPNLSSPKLLEKRDNMMRKHNEIEKIMRAQDDGDCYAVVLGTDFFQAKWREDVVAKSEESYTKYLEDRLENGKTQQAKRDTQRPARFIDSTRKTTPEHQSTAEALLKLDGNAALYVILMKTPSASRAAKIYLERKSQEDIAALAQGILQANEEIEFKLVTVESLQ